MVKKIYALLRKDVLLEFRQKHTFYGVLLYIASTIFVLYLSIESPDANVWNGLFWSAYKKTRQGERFNPKRAPQVINT